MKVAIFTLLCVVVCVITGCGVRSGGTDEPPGVAPPPATALPPATVTAAAGAVERPTITPGAAVPASTAPPTATAPAYLIPVTETPTETAAPVPTEPAEALAVGSLLTPRGSVPLGVEAEIALPGTGGVPGCIRMPRPELPPRIDVPRSPIHTGQRTWLCFSEGVLPDVPVDVQIDWPDGQVERYTLAPDAPIGLTWIALPGEPLGDYRVSFVQGERSASASFTVQAPASPTLLIEPESAPLGSTFSIVLAGFPPDYAVSIHVYEWRTDCAGFQGGECNRYVTTLPPILTDDKGEAVFALPTTPDDPPGSYRLELIDGSVELYRFFWLR